MNRDYLEDYDIKEEELQELLRNVDKGRFSFGKDRFPPDERARGVLEN